jgi:hypothetical protein
MIRTLSVALLVMTSGIALSQNQGGNSQGGNGQGQNGQGYNSPVAAPEIDPAGAINALMLMAGTVAIIRGYRRKKT